MLSAVAVVAASVVGLPGPDAAAGGMDHLYPVRDRYEPGDVATMIGYTVRATDPQVWEHADPDVLDWSDTGPFHGYLRARHLGGQGDQGGPIDSVPGILPDDIDLGEVEVAPVVGDPDLSTYVRVSLTFAIPDDLPAAPHQVVVTNPTGTHHLGHLDASWIYVGIDLGHPVIRSWPHHEPAIAELPADALVWGTDGVGRYTAAEIRSGAAASPRPATSPGSDGDRRDATDRPATDTDRNDDPDELVAAGGPEGSGKPADGTDIGGILPWMVVAAVLVGLWRVAARSPRKRISSPSPSHGNDDAPGVGSGRPVRFRL